jgi:hypothetical protein
LWFAIAVLAVLLGLAYCRPFTIDVDDAGDVSALCREAGTDIR